MSDRQLFRLVHVQARAGAIKAIHDAPDGQIVTIAPPKRSLEMNAKFHALCDDIARSGFQWAGKVRSAADWKVLLVSAHAVATKDAGEIVPGIEREFVMLRESTAQMSKARGSSLIEYTVAFCAMHSIKTNAEFAP